MSQPSFFSFDPTPSYGGKLINAAGKRVKGTLHWVSIPHALKAEVRLYDRLFSSENPDAEEGEFIDYLNPVSLEVRHVPVEPGLSELSSGHVQFERQGYFYESFSLSISH